MSSIGEESVHSSVKGDSLVELWKRSEFLKFQEYLVQLENERTGHLKEELGRIRKIERKLKLKLVELENKERTLVGQETEIRQAREDMALKLRRQADDHQTALNALKEQHVSALKMEKDKLKAEEAKRRNLELELTSKPPNKPVNVREKPNDETTVLKEKMRELESELKLKDIALDQAKERETILVKSRDHFRSAVLRMTCDQRAAQLNSEEVVFRLQQRRAELIASGLYHEEDDVIRQLDVKIIKAVG
jgi:hypothetical protein